MKFFDWAYGADGDALAAKLHYIPLPDSVTDTIRKAWPANIKGPDGKGVSGRSQLSLGAAASVRGPAAVFPARALNSDRRTPLEAT